MMNAPLYWVLLICASCLFASSFVLPILYVIHVGLPNNGLAGMLIVTGLFFTPQCISIWAMLKARDLQEAENFGDYNE